MTDRSIKFLPGTKPGKWSLGLAALMPVLLFIGTSFIPPLYESVSAGGTLLTDLTARPLLALTMLAGTSAGIAGFIVGLFAIIGKKERAILVFLSTLIGSFPLIYLIGELIFPS